MDWRKTFLAWLSALVLLAPIAAHAGEWQTYLKDDFSSSQTMFYTGPLGTAYYGIDESGRYIVDGLSAPGDSMAILTDSLYYYYFEGEGEVVDTLAGDLASLGLVFHYNKRVRPGQNSYYVFYIYSDGYYGVKRVLGDADGNVDILIPLAKTEMIDPNYPNVLAVDAQGSRFDLYINGKYVDGFTDLNIDGGGFGFYSTKKTKAAFDNFSVKIERREMGRDNLAQPEVNQSREAEQSGFSFQGYSPPVIKRDPNRPLYPWEVGYVEPEDNKQTADDPPKQPVESEPIPEKPRPDPEPAPEPEPEPVTTGRKPDLVVAQAKPVITKPDPVEPTKVKTHSYGEFGYDENSSEVKIVSADELALPDEPSEFEQPFNVEAKSTETAKPKAASFEDMGLPVAKVLDTNIRPDWLKDSEVKADGQGDTSNKTDLQTDPKAVRETTGKPAGDEVVSEAKPIAEAQAKPVVATPVRRRNNGIGGNDDWWDDGGQADTPEPRVEKPSDPKQVNATPAEKVPELPVNEINATVPRVQEADPLDLVATGDTTVPSGNLSLFPATAKPETPVEPQAGGQAPIEPKEQPVDDTPGQGLSFREATPVVEPAPVVPALETQVVINPASDTRVKLEPASSDQSSSQLLTKVQTERDVQNAELSLFIPEPADDEQIERPKAQPKITIIDDFSEQTWPVADNGVSSYRYFGAAYEIDNRMADTMAISFQQNELANAQYSVESEFLDGISEVGYGLAAQFQVNGGNASYYGLFISHSGEYLLLKVIGGEEEVLVDWTPCNLLKPNTPNIISLEIASPSIKVFINGKLVTTQLDSSLRSGGYALLAGPGVAARFDNLVVNGDPAH